MNGAIVAIAGRSIDTYIFGSALHDLSNSNDIDLLLVYRDGDLASAHDVADNVRRASKDKEFDVLAMSDVEECELGFIESQRAVCIICGSGMRGHSCKPTAWPNSI